MYCDYYGFDKKPFNITPDPDFIFFSEQHKEAFAHLLYGIDSHIGFISLTGEIGTGKTTVIRTLLGQLAADKYRTALIFNPCLSSLGLMQHINREYGLPAAGPGEADLLDELNRFLLAENSAGRTVVLVVDEAQNLDPAVLEQIRLISNLETERDKLIQIVLVGQPELRDLLARRELRQLGQRIGVSYHLAPMGLSDTRAYICHRIELAGRRDPGLFTNGAVQKIFAFSEGFPRVINLVCDRALLLGYTLEKTPISPAMAAAAISDIKAGRSKPAARNRLRFVASVAIIALVAVFIAFAVTKKDAPTASVPKTESPLSELSKTGEAASAVAAFNAIAALSKIPPIEKFSNTTGPEQLARERGLECYRFTGSFTMLTRLKQASIMELSAGGAGKRYLALTGTDGDKALIAPALGGSTSTAAADLERAWSGRAFILWRNYLDIPPNLKADSRGEAVKRLQGLLRGAGSYSGRLTGKLDSATVSAVKAFQSAHGIEETGIAGRQTLLLLYGNGGLAGTQSPYKDRFK